MMTTKGVNFLQFISGEESIITKKAGEEITRTGKPGDVMYVLKSGQARINFLGGRYPVDLEPGMLIGLMGLFDGRDYEDTCEAITDCELIPINRRRAEFMVQEHPTFPFRVMRVMIDRFYYVMDLLKETCKPED
jgi:CRP-like cAMP-binding protein